MVFSATPWRRYSTSGCQLGMARAKLGAADSSNIRGSLIGTRNEEHGTRNTEILLPQRGEKVPNADEGEVERNAEHGTRNTEHGTKLSNRRSAFSVPRSAFRLGSLHPLDRVIARHEHLVRLALDRERDDGGGLVVAVLLLLD